MRDDGEGIIEYVFVESASVTREIANVRKEREWIVQIGSSITFFLGLEHGAESRGEGLGWVSLFRAQEGRWGSWLGLTAA